MKLLVLLLISAFVTMGLGEAQASSIDFRTTTFTVGGSNPDHAPLAEAVVDGITVRIVPRPTPDAELYWDSTDGFGVRYAYENDEIEERESLLITFWDQLDQPVTVNLTSVHLTDLFNEHGYLETGWYDADDNGALTWFEADPGAGSGSNGVKWLGVSEQVHAISFGAPGKINNGENHEFSVAGLEFTTTATAPIPEPSSAVLFACGALLVGSAVRRRSL